MKQAIMLFFCLLLALGLSSPVVADIVLNPEDISWTTEAGIVTFQLHFTNPDQAPTLDASGELFSQEYGAFLPDLGTIGTFDIPPIPPESFFDVFMEIPLDQLPPSASEILPWVKSQEHCPPDYHWDGNVDVIWAGPGGQGQVQGHYGTLQACPGYGASCIHVVTACAGNATWAIVGGCAGFTVSLLNEDMTPAPNPVPPGWSGHICVTADASVPLGTTCCIAVNFTCGGVTIPVNLCVDACDCGPISTDPTTWGYLKTLYR
jgi:hypothetical protein